jgi:hypothetical protein
MKDLDYYFDPIENGEIIFDIWELDFQYQCTIDFVQMEVEFEIINVPHFEDDKTGHSFFVRDGRVKLLWSHQSTDCYYTADPSHEGMFDQHLQHKMMKKYAIVSEAIGINDISRLPNTTQKHAEFRNLLRNQMNESEYAEYIEIVNKLNTERPCETRAEKMAEKIILHAHANRWTHINQLLKRIEYLQLKRERETSEED